MADKDTLIKILPPEVSNKIAAGEVIQRPASVVKELLDNAIDAGADHISVVLQDAGRTMIQVRDNGCGMSENDIKLCFLRHATSKISHIDDLKDIRTLGFRGEAMASMASVAQVTVATKRVEDENGIEFEIHGGQEIRLEPAATDNGTTVTLSNLFYNVPARRAFLKTDPTEFRHILLTLHQAAIAHPEIKFDLDANGEILYRLRSNDLKTRISELFGKSYLNNLFMVDESSSMVQIFGYLSDPKLAKKTRGEQFLFINKRPFYHRHLNYIIMELYRDWIQPGQFPFYALFFQLNPEWVDVNVHPSKQEVKFEDERMISGFTRSVVKKGLNENMKVPFLDKPENHHGFDYAPYQKKRFGGTAFSQSDFGRSYQKSPVPPDSGDVLYGSREGMLSKKEPGFFGYGNEAEEKRDEQNPENPNLLHPSYSKGLTEEKSSKISHERGFWQVHNHFIFSQTRNGIFIMDQKAAHKRVLFDKIVEEMESGIPSTQQLLFPKAINFSAADFSLLKELHPLFLRMGFNIQLLSGNSAMILGVPSDIRIDNEQDILESVMEQYKNMRKEDSLNQKEKAALAVANKSAISANKKLSPMEMEGLVDQLFACENPFHDPLGKVTVRALSLKEIQSMFR